jgi:hypothetical protein
MKTAMLTISLLCLAVLASVSHASPVRKPPKMLNVKVGQEEAQLVVKTQESLQRARLVIPDKLVGSPVGEAEKQGRSGIPFPTIVVGVALALAFVSGGAWLIGRGKPGRTAALLLLGLLIVGGCGQTNKPATDGKGPGPGPKVTSVSLPATVTLSEEIELAIADGRDHSEVTLYVGPEAVAKGDNTE